MGNLIAKVFDRFWGYNYGFRIFCIGLDNAGKTTILYKLKLGEVVITLPTIGFNVESIQYKNVNLTVWDVGGQDNIRPLWRYYYTNTNGIIFVIDSNDRERIGEAKEELFKVINDDQLKGVPLLLFANKQDQPNTLSLAEISERLSLDSIKDRQYLLQSCSALSGAGIYEGLDFLAKSIKNH
eukprot:gene4908-6119_t